MYKHRFPSLLMPLIFLIASLQSCSGGPGSDSGNQLKLGNESTSKLVSISNNGAAKFLGKKKEEILNLRAKFIAHHPELLNGTYVPSETIFGGITDGKDWWGAQGYAFYDQGIPAITGLSKESGLILNPFLLVFPYIQIKSVSWDTGRFPTIQEFSQSNFPVMPLPDRATIYPAEAREEISIDTMKIFNQANQVVSPPIQFSDIHFDLSAFNAKDFGYNYMYVDPSQSSNINKYPNAVIEISENFQAITADSPSGSCNELRSVDDAVKDFSLKDLPAKLHICLWKEKPASYLAKPDFSVTLKFQ
ncbi:MAG: hypothetical protein K2W82_06400 [Candidatus Obscuribacterales bacterium]|nr:hypothetical protein [Candidatus Obscuribacterales bacterium]